MLAACSFGFPSHSLITRPGSLNVNGDDKIRERHQGEEGEEKPEGGSHVLYVDNSRFIHKTPLNTVGIPVCLSLNWCFLNVFESV